MKTVQSATIKNQINYLSGFMLEQRFAQLTRVLSLRTQYITVCLENIYQSQNASAVLRTCDAFGIQTVHVIEQDNFFTVNPDVALGTDKWLDVKKYRDLKLIDTLRANNYRIVATTPRDNSISLDDFDLNKGKVALFFGTELTGLSEEMMECADEFLHIPMSGFVESLNVSVSASITLHHLTSKLRASDLHWSLEEEERDLLLLKWLKKSVRKSDLILNRLESELLKG